MNRNPRHHCLRGFTIVELLVVVLIVVALSAITLALIRKSMVSGRMAASSANIRQLALANITYLSEHGTYCPAMDRRNLVRWHGARTSRRGHSNQRKDSFLPIWEKAGKSASVLSSNDWSMTRPHGRKVPEVTDTMPPTSAERMRIRTARIDPGTSIGRPEPSCLPPQRWPRGAGSRNIHLPNQDNGRTRTEDSPAASSRAFTSASMAKP